MEIHESIRELVTAHGSSILDDADGFRGVLDDVLDEGAASAGDINLLVDAVRFNALQSLTTMISGGADPARAVEEAGLRLARDRGGDGHAAASWATAVLGYAIGEVPADILGRFRSQRPGASGTSSTPAPTFTPPPPPTPGFSPSAPPPATAWPVTQPPAPSSGFLPPPGSGSVPRPSSFPTPGSVPNPGSGASFPAVSTARTERKRTGLWIALVAAFALLVGGGVLVAVLAGGEEKKEDPTAKPDPAVDVTPEALNERYAGLSGAIAAGTSECKAVTPGEGQSEVIECAVTTGTLRLITFDGTEELKKARQQRIDTRMGTLSGENGALSFYEFDPENDASSSEPALIYWDNADTSQSAELTGTEDAKLASLTAAFTNTQPKVKAPTEPSNPVLREFVEINMSVGDCKRGVSYGEGTTEESMCTPKDDVSVFVARYDNRRDMLGQRRYYRRVYLESDDRSTNDYWRFGSDGTKEGVLYGYVSGGTPTLYWDWDKADCNCYAVAYGYGISRAELEQWWAGN